MSLNQSENQIQRIICRQLIDKMQLAYFTVDADLCVREASPNLGDYGYSILDVGQQVDEVIDFMIGMDASTRIDLPFVSSPSGIPVSVRLLPDNDTLLVLISNASEANEQRRLLQQAANENELLVEQQKKLMSKLEAASTLLEEKNTQLKEASRLQTSFLSGVSHEFRTPLTSIIGYTELMVSQLHQEQEADAITSDRKSVDSHLGAVKRSSQHLLSLVENLLDHGKLDSGEIVIRPKETALFDVIGDVESVTSVLSESKGVSLNFDFASLENYRAVLDETRLRQCLINLVGNAIKFTDEGSVTVDVAIQNECLEVTIADTGLGISEQDLEKIRLPFYQAADTGKVGTGLGLTITERIVEMMGGALSIESKLGEGTTVQISMPAPQAPDMDLVDGISAKNEVLQPSQEYRILLVEDDADIAELLVMLLMEKNAQVEHVSNGALAVDAAKEGDFDLILMDIHMPVMTGYEAMDQLNRQGVQTPVVVMSASAIEADQARAAELGCIGYLVKPIDADEIMSIASTIAPAKLPR